MNQETPGVITEPIPSQGGWCPWCREKWWSCCWKEGNFYEVVSRKLPNELRSSVLVIVFVELDGVALLVADPPPANSTTLNVSYFVFLID